jgi:hypothetical protein
VPESRPQRDHRTEPDIAIRIAIVVVEREHASISRIAVIATTYEERIARVRQIQFNPYISKYFKKFKISKYHICLHNFEVF